MQGVLYSFAAVSSKAFGSRRGREIKAQHVFANVLRPDDEKEANHEKIL